MASQPPVVIGPDGLPRNVQPADNLIAGSLAPGVHLLGLPNGNFEDAIGTPGAAASYARGWTAAVTGTGSTILDPTAANKLTGANSVKMVLAAAADTVAYTSGLFPAGGSIPLSICARAKSSGQAARLTVTVNWFTNTSTANGSTVLNQTTGLPAAYADYGATVMPPSGTSYGQVVFKADTAVDTVWVDEVPAYRETVFDVDLRRFGAYGDNAADDTAALQRALAFLSRAGGGTLCVRQPHYLNPSAATAITVPTNVELRFGPLGRLKAGANLTLTLACRITAGMWRIFDITGTGTINMSNAGVREALAEWWGCVADGATDNTAAMLAFINSAVAQGVRGLLAKGNYACSSSMVWNLQGSQFNGVRLEGMGKHATTITLGKGASIIVTSQSGTYTFDSNGNITNAQSTFYAQLLGFSVSGNVDGSSTGNGVVMHIGRPPVANADGSDKTATSGAVQFPDQINLCYFDISVSNSSISQYAISLEMNSHYGSSGILQATGGGSPGFANPSAGTCLRLREVQFCNYNANLGGANLGMLLDYYSLGNVFPNCDIEEVNACVRLYTAGSSFETTDRNNKWNGGQFSWYGASNPMCIADACGNNCLFDNCNISPRANTNAQTWVTGNDERRVVLANDVNVDLAPPSPPASGAWFANPFNRKAFVTAYALSTGSNTGVISSAYVAPVDSTGLTTGTAAGLGIPSASLYGGGTQITRPVGPGEFISINYTGTIYWVWDDP